MVGVQITQRSLCRRRLAFGWPPPPPALPLAAAARVGKAKRLGTAMPAASANGAPLSVAVVGAGAAGLVAARELERAGLAPTVLEQSDRVGGVWAYTERAPDHPLGAGGTHSSMYKSLRTNLPRHTMGFSDFPFDGAFPGSADGRLFPHHAEVQRYLEAFAAAFGLLRHVRFGAEVAAVEPLGGPGAECRWRVTTRQRGADGSVDERQETYDAVVVANGHFSEPRLPDIPGRHLWPGRQVHSHAYRRPGAFAGQSVVVVGAASSGADIALELAAPGGARRVLVSSRDWAALPPLPRGAAPRLAPAADVAELRADGAVVFADGAVERGVDVVLYCTGYVYRFPFLENGAAAPAVRDNAVGPLYEHVWPPAWAPRLALLALPWKVLPFPQAELQAKWVAAVLAGRAALPARAEMEAAAAAARAALAAAGAPLRYAHRMSGGVQWAYNDALAAAAGAPPMAAWRRALYDATGEARRANLAGYRDLELPGAGAALAAAAAEAEAVRQAGALPKAISR